MLILKWMSNKTPKDTKTLEINTKAQKYECSTTARYNTSFPTSGQWIEQFGIDQTYTCITVDCLMIHIQV